jgi:hypothetical protein
MIVYATPEDLAAWLGAPAPANAESLIRKASGLVSNAVRGAVYTTTSEGLPTLPAHVTALQEATLSQVEAWIDAGISSPGPAAAATRPQRVASKSLGGASVSYAQDAAADAAWARLAGGVYLTDAALQILDAAGLLSNNVQDGYPGWRDVHRPYDYIGGTTIDRRAAGLPDS